MPKFIDRTGETSIASNGMTMKIIVCRGSHDIDVQFEDGAISQHKTYDAFLSGKIMHPNASSYTSWRVGETNLANNGQQMKIVKYRSATDIDIQFEDGTVVEHKTYSAFKKGEVINPSIQWANGFPSSGSRVGETNRAVNGQCMTLITYRSAADIDVQFEDGTIVCNTSYKNFKRGAIRNPNLYHTMRSEYIDKVLTTKYLMHNGIYLSVTNYRGSKSADILFETGHIKENVNYDAVKSGSISHPFPYAVGDIEIKGPAYIYNGLGNFYCHCTKCGIRDIMTIEEMKSHKCIAK